MQIAELATQASLPVRTVRYYADRGLIKPARRSAGGYRIFDEDSLRQLRFVRRLRGLGLTLRELERIVRAAERLSCGDSSVGVRQRLTTQLATVGRRIDELKQVQHELSSLIARQTDGCTDELCLCRGQEQVETARRRRTSAERSR